MAVKIIESCVNCFACEPVCPSSAIYEAKPHFLVDSNLVPLITKPEKIPVAFAKMPLTNKRNNPINQYHKTIFRHWHGLCICFE